MSANQAARLPPWEARDQFLRGLRAVFALSGLVVLLGSGARLILNGHGAEDSYAVWLWHLVEGCWLVGACVALILIWIDAAEGRTRADSLERYQNEREESLADALAQGKRCSIRRADGTFIWVGRTEGEDG